MFRSSQEVLHSPRAGHIPFVSRNVYGKPPEPVSLISLIVCNQHQVAGWARSTERHSSFIPGSKLLFLPHPLPWYLDIIIKTPIDTAGVAKPKIMVKCNQRTDMTTIRPWQTTLSTLLWLRILFQMQPDGWDNGENSKAAQWLLLRNNGHYRILVMVCSANSRVKANKTASS